MFEKFGEFDSYREINELAENLFNEGDIDSIRALAAENGIGKSETEEYINGDTAELCCAFSAAWGKLDIECKELKPKEIMEDWVEYIRCACGDSNDMVMAVRRKDKSLRGCIIEILKWSFSNQRDIDQKMIKAAGVNASKVTSGTPGMGRAKKIIREYYLGKQADR